MSVTLTYYMYYFCTSILFDVEKSLKSFFFPIGFIQVNGSEKNGSRSGKFHDTFELNATCQLWSEAILSLVVAAFGLVGNLTSIWVLSVPEMRCTAFNRLLLALALVDIMFIGPGEWFSNSHLRWLNLRIYFDFGPIHCQQKVPNYSSEQKIWISYP